MDDALPAKPRPASSAVITATAVPSSGGLQFSLWDLGVFLVACAGFFGMLRFVFMQVDNEHGPAFESPLFLVALLYWPLPMAVLGLLPRRNLGGEAAPGLSGYALWRVTGVLYPLAYLTSTLVQGSAEGLAWPAALGVLGAATLWFLALGALVLWECGESSHPPSLVHWIGLLLYLYLLVAVTCSVLLAVLIRDR